jgi:hypothetical protein
VVLTSRAVGVVSADHRYAYESDALQLQTPPVKVYHAAEYRPSPRFVPDLLQANESSEKTQQHRFL